MNATAQKPIKPLHPRSVDTKYTGPEPTWQVQPSVSDRKSRLGQAFHWYGYHYSKKEAKEFVIDWLNRNQRTAEARQFQRVPDAVLINVYGWMARMDLVGLELTEAERTALEQHIQDLIKAGQQVKEVTQPAEDPVIRPNIQDRLREKMLEAAGELEAMYDDMIARDCRMGADFKPMAVIRGMNVAPQMMGDIVLIWKNRMDELQEAMSGRDADLVEGYGHFTKTQLKNLVKFCETVVADCGSWVQIKKTERAPRKKKPVSPERLTQKFRYLKEFSELKLTSEPVTKLVGCQEAWLYDTKKRKLIYVVADSHIGTMTVKGTSLVGFDTTNSVQKTLRKPAEQIKGLLTGGVAQHRKFFKDIKATEVRFNGRGNENMILLKAR